MVITKFKRKQMEEIKFRHTLPIQLRFNDVDKFGHVNNTVYFSFYDLGKTEYFASVCPGVDWEKDEFWDELKETLTKLETKKV